MNAVSFQVSELGSQHAARMDLLLKLRLAVTQLNNEARKRMESESRRELKPPFPVRLDDSRDEVDKLLRQLELPPLTQDPLWSQLPHCSQHLCRDYGRPPAIFIRGLCQLSRGRRRA